MNAGFAMRMAAARSCSRDGLFFQAPAPCSSPCVIGGRIGEQCADCLVAFRSGRGIAQPAEGQGEVGAVGGHALEQILGQRRIALALGEEAKLAAQAGSASRFELRREGGERFVGRGQRGFFAARPPAPERAAMPRRGASGSSARRGAGCHRHSGRDGRWS